MSTQTDTAVTTANDPPPQLVDRDRWSGDVVETGTVVYEWGTYRFPARVQKFDDGTGNVQVAAPRSPPLSAVEIVSDGLASDTKVERAIAAVLADAWGVDHE